MNIEEIIQRYKESDGIAKLASLLKESEADISLSGLIGSQESFIAAATFKATEYNHLFILNDKEEAAYFQNNLTSILTHKDVFFFPDSFKRPQAFEELNNTNVMHRTEAVNRLSHPSSRAELAVTYPEALFEKAVKKEKLEEQTLRIKKGERLDIDFMIELLVDFEFERVDFVYERDNSLYVVVSSISFLLAMNSHTASNYSIRMLSPSELLTQTLSSLLRKYQASR